jgi:hypothetical protein
MAAEIPRPGQMWEIDDSEAPGTGPDDLWVLHPVVEDVAEPAPTLTPCSVCGVPCGDGLHDGCLAERLAELAEVEAA